MKLSIYCDGSHCPNSGRCGVGVVIMNQDRRIILEVSRHIGQGSSMMAEYMAVIESLRMAIYLDAHTLAIYSDAELVVKQLNGVSFVTDDDMRPMFAVAKDLIDRLGNRVSIYHTLRQDNPRADMLAKRARTMI